MEYFDSELRAAYYPSSDGPRIIIFGSLDADFGKLQRLFRNLADMPNSSCRLHEQPFIRPFNGLRVTLSCWGPQFPKRPDVWPLLHRIDRTNEPIFNWCLSPDQWNNRALTMDRLVQSVTPMHEYLTSFPHEPAIVVLSKGEYGDAILACRHDDQNFEASSLQLIDSMVSKRELMESQSGPTLRLGYYAETKIPHIVIFGPMDADFPRLQEVFWELSRMSAGSYEMHSLPFLSTVQRIKLTLRSSGSMFHCKSENDLGLRYRGAKEGREFLWQRTAENWDYTAWLMGGLIRSTKPGHQYFTSYPGQAAVMLVSRGEHGDNVVPFWEETIREMHRAGNSKGSGKFKGVGSL